MIKNYLDRFLTLIEKGKTVRRQEYIRRHFTLFQLAVPGPGPGASERPSLVIPDDHVDTPMQNQTDLFTRIYFFQFQAQAGKTAQFDMFDQKSMFTAQYKPDIFMG